MKGSALASISSRVPDSTTSKVSIESASPPSKWNCLPVSASSSARPLSGSISSAATFGLTRTQERLGVDVGDRVAQGAQPFQGNRLRGEDDAFAVAGRTRAR